jgi:tRNA A37 threonylcarbamoyladenosine modification protein TsaB
LSVEYIRIGVFVLRGVVYGLECNFVRLESLRVFFSFFLSVCVC